MFTGKIQLTILLCALCASPAINAEPAKKTSKTSQVTFSGGNKIHGSNPLLLGENQLSLDIPRLKQPAIFKLDQVLSINLPRNPQAPVSQPLTFVYLHPHFRADRGDTLTGTLKAITKNHLLLGTTYAGDLSINRALIQSIRLTPNGKEYYHGPIHKTEWTIIPAPAWQFHKQTMTSHTAGIISRNFNLTELSQVSFNISWQIAMRFKLRLYSSHIKKANSDAYYEVNLNRSYAYLRTHGKPRKMEHEAVDGGQWQRCADQPQKNKAFFEIFTNRKTGIIHIYINSKHACKLESQNPDPKNLGKGISFIAEDHSQLSLSEIKVAPWDGITLPIPKPTQKNTPPTNTVSTNNGKNRPFTTATIHDNHLVTKHPGTQDLRIPLADLRNIDLSNTKEEPRKFRHDIRAWFQNGGHITLRLKSLKNGKLTGYHQAHGEVTYNLSTFGYLEFNIYNRHSNKQR